MLSLPAHGIRPDGPRPASCDAGATGRLVEIEVLGSRPDFGSPQGTKEEFDKGDKLMLPPLDGFMLNLIPTNRRSTFGLWNFDPNPLNPRKTDPVPQPYTYTMWGRSSFDTIDYGHGLYQSAVMYSIGCRKPANTGSGASIRARRCLSPCLRSSPDAGPTSTRRITGRPRRPRARLAPQRS